MYAYYLEGYGNGIFHRTTIQARSVPALEKKVKAYHVGNKIANVGWVLYQFNTSEELKYKRENYKIVKQYNAKAFFEFWS